MTDIARLLRDGDPVAGESFPAGAVDGMLGRLRLEAERGALAADSAPLAWGIAWRVMATALTCVALFAVAVLARRESPLPAASAVDRSPDRRHAPGSDRPATSVVPVRHLQFSTPEGIRVFWTFDPDFQENRR
jgi:hypothetical protein